MNQTVKREVLPPSPVYLDHHATTPVAPAVLQAMLPFFTEKFGNAASIHHRYGSEAADAVAAARRQIADFLNAGEREIIFTSGATESNNLALKGVLRASGRSAHLITTAAEHRAVLDPARVLQREGVHVTILPVDEFGRVSPQQVEQALRPETILVSVMLANNEIGTLNPVAEIGQLCRKHNVLLHTDAVQAAAHIPLDVESLQVDLLSLSAHKMYGPKGVGVLYVRRKERRIRLMPLIDGGGQEQRMRSGTLPVPLIVGFAAACRVVTEERQTVTPKLQELRDRLWNQLSGQLDGIHLNGHPEDRLPNNLNVSFEGVNGEALMMALRDIAVSSGSACTSADPEPSHVLRAIGRPDPLVRASLRFGLGRDTTPEDIDIAANTVIETVSRLRRMRAQPGVSAQ